MLNINCLSKELIGTLDSTNCVGLMARKNLKHQHKEYNNGPTLKHEILFYTISVVFFLVSFLLCEYFYEKMPIIPSPKNATTFNENFAKLHVHYLSKIIGTSLVFFY